MSIIINETEANDKLIDDVDSTNKKNTIATKIRKQIEVSFIF